MASKTANTAKSNQIRASKRNARTRAAAARAIEVVQFNFATRGLDTCVADWYINDERDGWATNDWEPNRCWNSVRLRRCDVASWIRAMDRYLCGAWTPNQESRGYEGAEDIRAGLKEMERLEALAH